MDKIEPPADIAAVHSGGKNFIFFVNERNQIAYYYGGSVQEAQGLNLYQKHERITVMIDGKPTPVKTNPANKDIAAIAFTVGTNKEIRLYYISSDDHLIELAKTNDGDWIRGDLGLKHRVRVVKGSAVSANVHEAKDPNSGRDVDYLKVFYNDFAANGHLACYFRLTAEQLWTPAILTNDENDPVF